MADACMQTRKILYLSVTASDDNLKPRPVCLLVAIVSFQLLYVSILPLKFFEGCIIITENNDIVQVYLR